MPNAHPGWRLLADLFDLPLAMTALDDMPQADGGWTRPAMRRLPTEVAVSLVASTAAADRADHKPPEPLGVVEAEVERRHRSARLEWEMRETPGP